MEEDKLVGKPTPLRVYMAWIGLNAVGLGVGSLGYLFVSGSSSLFQLIRGVGLDMGVRDEYDAFGLAILVFAFHFTQWFFLNARAYLKASAILITATTFYLVLLGTLHFALQLGILSWILSLSLFSFIFSFSELLPKELGLWLFSIFAVGVTGSVVIYLPAIISTMVLGGLSRTTTVFPNKWQRTSGIAGILLGAIVGLAIAAMMEQDLIPEVVMMTVAGAIYGLLTVHKAVKVTARTPRTDDHVGYLQ